jgi:phthiocerol/phenolphthiocerol synthesis type-I polyketide synthase E
MHEQASDFDIAIIGMACRFPGAADVDAYWRNLCEGQEFVRRVPDELLAANVPEAMRRDPAFVPVAATAGEVEMFDAALFGYTPREAELMDPQQRIFLECAWTALERAGHIAPNPEYVIGVYGGAALSSYLLLHVLPHVQRMNDADPLQINLGNANSFLTTRVSYKLDLRGPSHLVESACSTSLVAVHVACQSLRNEECDLALAGGVSINLSQRYGYRYIEGSILSPDGRCRPFDADARGIVFGSGAGVVVLRRLGDALADGDHIHAVIRGSAVNNDGALRAGYTAPGVDGQAEVITEALANAGLTPAAIGLVEAHGTGTLLGDPIEIRALDKVFRGSDVALGSCPIGSVKGNVGHLDAAAGVAGLIKAALAVEHGVIPASLHCDTPNPNIDWAHSAFNVQRARSDWQPHGDLRRAGVSSFGMGGTNAHVIVEEPPARTTPTASKQWQLVLLSARTTPVLDTMTQNLAAHLHQAPDSELADVSFTLQAGRRRFAHRRMAVCRDTRDAVAVLSDPHTPRLLTQHEDAVGRGVVFLFPGQGAQHITMSEGLYETDDCFRAELDACAERLRPHLDVDIRTLLFPPTGREARAREALLETRVTQPALFAVEYALARLLMSWGIEPRAMIGHSVGEYVAACLAGVFSLDDAVALIAKRGQLMHALPEGAMLSVSLSEERLGSLLGQDLSLAAANAPGVCVVSGTVAAIDAFQTRLEAEGIGCRRLHVSRAFHSAMTEPLLDELAAHVRTVRLHAPQLPFISNVSGTWSRAEEVTKPEYWAQHMRQPVRFARGIEELARHGNDVLVEVGPGNTLTTLARQTVGDRTTVATMRRPSEDRHDREALLDGVGRMWLAGVDVDWSRAHDAEQRRRLPLPTYPFERVRYWLDSSDAIPAGALAAPADRISAGNRDIADWCYLPEWQRTLTPVLAEDSAPASWLVLVDAHGLGTTLAQRLRDLGHEVVQVACVDASPTGEAGIEVLDPAEPDAYRRLIGALDDAGGIPDRIVHCWTVAPPAPDPWDAGEVSEMVQRGYGSLLLLARALAAHGLNKEICIDVVSSHAHHVGAVADGAVAHPIRAAVLGPCRVLPQEYDRIRCRGIDITWPPLPRYRDTQVESVLAELLAPTTEMVVAYRRGQRWVPEYRRCILGREARAIRSPAPGGAWILLCGADDAGPVIAGFLAREFGATVTVIADQALPPRAEWGQADQASSALAGWIRAVHAVEDAGGRAVVEVVDSTDGDALRGVIDRAIEAHGAVRGVIQTRGCLPASFEPIAALDVARDVRRLDETMRRLLAVRAAVLGQTVDVCLVCCSTASVLGGLGIVNHAAASLMAGTMASSCAASEPTITWLAVDWDPWPAGGNRAAASYADPHAMTMDEANEALARVLGAGLDARVLMSTGDLDSRLATWVSRAAALRATPSQAHARPNLKNPYVAPRNQDETAIVAIWQGVLGIAPIGVHDNFFELGGHSLLATAIVGRLREAFAADVPLQQLFEAPTVAQTAALLRSEPASNLAEDDDVETRELLRLLSELSTNDKEGGAV